MISILVHSQLWWINRNCLVILSHRRGIVGTHFRLFPHLANYLSLIQKVNVTFCCWITPSMTISPKLLGDDAIIKNCPHLRSIEHVIGIVSTTQFVQAIAPQR